MRIFLSVVLILFSVVVFAQDIDVSKYHQQYQLHIFKKTSAITVDGELNEAAWQTNEVATNFWLKFPQDNGYAKNQSIFRSCYDDKFLYIGAKVFDIKPFIGTSLKRDSRIRENDGISIVIDPMNKKTNGFYFSVTAFNVQADDLMSGGDNDLTYSWDNKWYSNTKQYDSFFTVEIAIPFKTLRYENNNTEWGINFIRSDRKSNQFHTWTRIPVNFRGTDIGYTGALIWDKPPPPIKTNIAFIPYINQNFVADKVNTDYTQGKFNAGFDAKVAVTEALNLDITVNPDFSQVEVDRQVTNLTRFSIFFPERRNFFLENSDLFSDFGIEPIRPFYSRTIGLDPSGNAIPILAGLRLTGNVNSKTRIGIMNMQTKATNTYAAQNYSALTAQKRVLKRSVVKAYFLNRDGFFTEKNNLEKTIDRYGRNAGAEFNYVSESGKYSAWAGLHHSMKPTVTNKNNYLNYGVGYEVRKFSSFVNFDHMGTNYYTDMGFVERIASYWGNTDSLVRNGFHSVYNETSFTIIPKVQKPINQHRFTVESFFVQNPNGSFNERSNEFRYNINFTNASFFQVAYENNTIQLMQPTSFTDNAPLPIGRYQFGLGRIRFETDARKKVVLGAGFAKGNFYNGKYEQITARFVYRSQPKFTFELNAEYNKVQLPQPYGNAALFLISPRIEMNFSTNLFWTTFIQYNTQANNINFNSRLQWRYKPVSDLFLVYTDNYFTDPLFKNKTRAIALKVNYWLNL
jgi:hypothetical protein